MNVTEILLQHFTKHANTKLAIPDKGIVLCTGANGSGKSSVIEAVAYAGWGKTLRGATPWQPDVKGVAAIVVDVGHGALPIQRNWSGKRVALQVGTEAETYETTTKAQEALDRLIGSFDVWQRACVFSSADAEGFSQATDGERKRLLESVLGLGVFDVAAEACRADQRRAETALSHAQALAAQLDERAAGLKRQVNDLQKQLAELPPAVDVSAFGAEEQRLAAFWDEANRRATSIQSERAVLLGERRQAQELATISERKATASQALIHCDRCDQPVEAKARQAIYEKHIEEMGRQDARCAAAKARADALVPDHDEAVAEAAALDSKRATLDAAIAAAAPVEKLRANGTAALTALQTQLVKALDQRKDLGLARTQAQLHEIEAASQVLGLKGVRAHVLGTALAGLEQAANGWLERIAGGGLRLSLKPYSEKKTGGQSDSISLEIAGAGGGFGYKASSGGERRRIDVALVLALAQIAHATSGRTEAAGTLFFDEVFDALDEEGVDAVIGVLTELARDRAVIVISHSALLAARLPSSVRWIVEGGAVRVS